MKNGGITEQLKMQEKENTFAGEKKNTINTPDINTSVHQ
jgi:hypothetical protein